MTFNKPLIVKRYFLNFANVKIKNKHLILFCKTF